jgi:hypothetical protein
LLDGRLTGDCSEELTVASCSRGFVDSKVQVSAIAMKKEEEGRRERERTKEKVCHQVWLAVEEAS